MKLKAYSGPSKQWYPFWWSVVGYDLKWGDLVGTLASGKAWSLEEAQAMARCCKERILYYNFDMVDWDLWGSISNHGPSEEYENSKK